jgi:hypothetical protein
MDNTNNPKVLATVPLPSPEERRLRRVTLTRLLLGAVDMTLAGESLGLEVARELIREVEHAYPELAAEWIESE